MALKLTMVAAGLVAAFHISINFACAAERETLSFGQEAPPAERVAEFLFPEAKCEHVEYQCLFVRPIKERSIGVGIRFPTGSSDLTDAARAQLQGLGKALAGRSGKLAPGEILVEGHTDARGSTEFNQKLSERRAQSVTQYLVSVFGVDARALKPVGRGKDQPIEVGRADSEVNRRVEFVRTNK